MAMREYFWFFFNTRLNVDILRGSPRVVKENNDERYLVDGNRPFDMLLPSVRKPRVCCKKVRPKKSLPKVNKHQVKTFQTNETDSTLNFLSTVYDLSMNVTLFKRPNQLPLQLIT